MFYSRKSRFRENNMVRPIEKFPFLVLVRSTIIGSMRTSGQNWNCLDKIEIFVLSAVSAFKFSKRANSVNSTASIFLCRAPKHRTFRRDNGSCSNSRTCGMFCASKSRPDRRRNAAYGVPVFTASISSKPSCSYKKTGIICH